MAAQKTTTSRTRKTTPRAPQDRKSPQAEPAKYAATTWGGPITEDLEVPSGQLCLVRRPGVEGLLKAGVLHNMDTLTAIVQTDHVDRVTNPAKAKAEQNAAVQDLLKDPAKIDSFMHTLDRITCYVVVQPELTMAPNDVTSRKDGVTYVDTVDLDDKMFLLNYAIGGTRDLETFREESARAVAGMGSQPEDEGTTE